MLFWFKFTWAKMIAFIETLKDDTCTPKPAKLNAWVYILCVYVCVRVGPLLLGQQVWKWLYYTKRGRCHNPDTGWCPRDNLWDQLAWNVGLSMLRSTHYPSYRSYICHPYFQSLLGPPAMKKTRSYSRWTPLISSKPVAVQILEFPCSVASLNWGIAWDTSGYHVAILWGSGHGEKAVPIRLQLTRMIKKNVVPQRKWSSNIFKSG